LSPLTGEPSGFDNLPPHPAVIEGVLESGDYNGYGHSSGIHHMEEAGIKEILEWDVSLNNCVKSPPPSNKSCCLL
jgi:hypothetical protein